MIEPLRLSFEVACSVEHAFAVWTAGIGTWWPAGHTVSGDGAAAVVLERRAGGREWRDRNRAGWETLPPHFVAAAGDRPGAGGREAGTGPVCDRGMGGSDADAA